MRQTRNSEVKFNSQDGGWLSNSKQAARPFTARLDSNVKQTAANLIFKRWGYDPSGVLKDTQIDINQFQKDNSLRSDHLKLFARVDRLVEQEKLKMEAKGLTPFDVEIADPKEKKREIKVLESCP